MTLLRDAAIILGTPLHGGFYAGTFQMNGELYGLVVSPKAGDLPRAPWQKSASDVANATSYFDGAANTIAMAEAGCPHAKLVQKLDLGGFTDWYLPARDELELLYRALKPSQETNYTWRSGDNPSSVPPGYPYTAALPAQTPAISFQEGGEEAFEAAWYWSSTQYSRTYAWYQCFDDGGQYNNVKSYEGRARAVRRFKVQSLNHSSPEAA